MEESSSAEDVLLAIWQVRSDRAGLILAMKSNMQCCAFSYMICSLVKEAVMQAAWLDARGIVNATRTDLQASLEALRRQGPVFTKELRAAGWQVDNVIIRLGPVRYQRHRHNGG